MRAEVVLRALAQVGGEAISETQARGRGWTAQLEPLDSVRLGVMVISRSLLVIEGEDDGLVTPVYDHMRRSMVRGGG